MNDTTTPAEGAPPPEPADQLDQAQTEHQVETDEQQQQADEQQRQSREDRRIAQLSARLAAETRERERLQAEAEAFRRTLPLPGGEESDEQRELRQRQLMRAEVEAEVRKERFHQEGVAEYGTAWTQKCSDLIAMGADPGMAQLIVELPDAVKVTVALADDPEAVQRIAGIRSERGRAIALGRYAASLDRAAAAAAADPPPQAAPRVAPPPPPVRPVSGGRATPAFDPYNPRHSTNDLYDFFAKQDAERRAARR